MVKGNKFWGSGGALAACGLLLALAGGLESALTPAGVSHGYLVAARDGNTAVAQAAGEFRVVAANLLWAKVVDHYHHQYMADGGNWSKNESLLPLLQTIIRLDPHFVEAYQLMGGTILPRTGHIAQGQTVLAEGIKNNPNDWEMYREMAMLYAWTEHQPAAALPYAQQGLAEADDDFSRRLMGSLCHTLQARVQKGGDAARRPQTLNARPPDRRPAPNLASSARPPRPPVSG